MGKKGEVISKKQLTDEFLNGFHVCEEMLMVEKNATCSEMDVAAIWQVLFCLTQHDAEEGEQCGGQDASLHPRLTLLEMGKLSDEDQLCFT